MRDVQDAKIVRSVERAIASEKSTELPTHEQLRIQRLIQGALGQPYFKRPGSGMRTVLNAGNYPAAVSPRPRKRKRRH